MPKDPDNKNMMEVIHKFSSTLSSKQLEEFVAIVDSFSSLLDTANKDTKKAYQLYEQSFAKMEVNTSKSKAHMH